MNEAEFVDFVGNLIASIYQMGLTNAEVTAALVNERREALAVAKRERDEARAALSRAKTDAEYCANSWENAIEVINAMQAQLKKMVAALDFYARRETYISRTGMDSPISRDGFGDAARSAISEME